MSISACWTTAACNLRNSGIVVGRRSCIRPTIQEPHRLSGTQFRLELRTRVSCVYAGRTASFVGTMLVVSLCAIGGENTHNRIASCLTYMKKKKPDNSYARAETVCRER